MRSLILVLDSVGIGGAADAWCYGDDGADTVGHIADWCAAGRANGASRQGPLQLPNLVRLGLGHACGLATGTVPAGLHNSETPLGHFGCASEMSKGKDTPSGHWEIAGVPVRFAWGYFPRERPCFPKALVDDLIAQAGLPGILGNCHASGTEIIAQLGPEHVRTTAPICYTSADSVFQIAAHEQSFGLQRLYAVCEIARILVDPMNIGRVIARPFIGDECSGFVRTGNRRDYAVPPPDDTILDAAAADGRHVVTIGKIGDIFAHRGTGTNLKADGNDALLDRTLEGMDQLQDGGLLFANFIDFDTLYGHRRDIAGYATALENFDARLPQIIARLEGDDLLIITADHGCDPTWKGTDHTRERVPILALGGKRRDHSLGARTTFADIGATVAAHLDLPATVAGTAF